MRRRFTRIVLSVFFICAFSLPYTVAQCNIIGTTIAVTNTNDAGPGSLREAIDCANTTPGPNTIQFAIPGFLDQHIYVGSTTGEPLPPLNDNATIIDGTTQPSWGLGGDFSPKIFLDGSLFNWTLPINALFIFGDQCEIYGLEIINFPDDAIDINGANNVIIGAPQKSNIIHSNGWELDFFPGVPGTGPLEWQWNSCTQ